ncbi:PREDICTED: protein PHYLLO, chloroplastic isoform X2 [Tarenaya hassleriana]|uniref:protein PHYLLO, chloroplastic isoform X2 n=1 Tax=Tarenaya hassleriana TaxID=28532 RepID=UPI00053CA733|nr:PREDICTED: protein PHYLLO, chloroplastic isoform X2 [Tarenaya hassleriana]
MPSSCSSSLFANPTILPFLAPKCNSSISIRRRKQPFSFSGTSTGFLRVSRYGFGRNFEVARGVKFDGPIMDTEELKAVEDENLMVEVCVTRTLPPALTLEGGLESIKEVVDELKRNPPRSCNGVMRFQVAVPPSAKALQWFCRQPSSSGVYPVFFLSKETDDPSPKSIYFKEPRGVFGIGTAISFRHPSCQEPGKQSMIKRFLSDDSILVTAYGFPDIDIDTDSTEKSKDECYYFFIPEIELNEDGGVSILAFTLAWNDSLFYTFEQAVSSCEASLFQVSCHFCPNLENHWFKHLRGSLAKLGAKELQTTEMDQMHFFTFSGRDFWADSRELKSAPSSCQFYCKLSPGVVFSNNMLNHASEVSCSLKDEANINTVWASAIIEECTRLGLTYFCVAPGSRSSPLAIAAASHPLTMCIACFDERSLAFHATGYARGSLKPAVVITSSGTAVSNLLPAVVEASEDCLPLLLLTADRPPELQNVGANQAINQVNHFGSFVRFFFDLPPPTDLIPIRMVLTTLDSVLHWAMCSPCGPVHLNCPFREPLDGSTRKWSSHCLNGLEMWMSNAEPFTKYFQVQSSSNNMESSGQMTEVLDVIKGAKKGLLLLGAIHTEDEIWAALLLAKHLSWPVVADILSGLRLRKLLPSFLEEQNIVFVDHLDHALLSDSVRDMVKLDVVIQFLWGRCELHDHLRALDDVIAREMAFQISTECFLTEPYVAHMLSKTLTSESALFIGNSMPIRDVDMYGCSSANDISYVIDTMQLPCHWIRVSANRGASGIDGLLSSATGFAVGCKKRVVCMVGDISFLHDTNGLAILRQRIVRKPVTILVINNHGGGIFRLLPIAERTEPSVLKQYFYTSHDISIEKLCMAHGLKYHHVGTKGELEDALFLLNEGDMDCVIEVESSIDANATVHSTLGRFAHQAADNYLGTILASSLLPPVLDNVLLISRVCGVQYSQYRIELCDRPTMCSVNGESLKFYREGYVLSLTLEDGSIGYGEVAPLDIHGENLMDIEAQLQLVLHVMKGAKISHMLPLLNGSISSWIWSELGITASSILPSVRCGLEMALLNVLVLSRGSKFLGTPHSQKEENGSAGPHSVRICALLDSEGTPSEVAYIASKLVEEGFTAIKLKVARRVDPVEDAVVLQEIRRAVGNQIELRADANRRWTFEEAIKFGLSVKSCNLKYIEEPVHNEDDLIRYCEESGLPVALDETLDDFQKFQQGRLTKYVHPGIVAVVIKPSVVGGFENAALIARWAQQHGKTAILSAAYESGLGLSAYILFSSYLEQQNLKISAEQNNGMALPVAHGLGTYRWLKEDVMIDNLGIFRSPYTGFVEGSVSDACKILKDVRINNDVILKTSKGVHVQRYELRVDLNGFSHFIKIHDIEQDIDGSVVLFLHGFLGTGEEWIPIMKGISGSACVRCISLDLPGHGSSWVQSHGNEKPTFSMEMIAEMLCKVMEQITPEKFTVVGYSMGARIALYMASRSTDKVEGAVVVSGSPGLKDPVARKVRRAKDDSKAGMIVAHGLEIFLENWYNGGLWKSLRSHPHFRKIVASRLEHDDVVSLAKVLSDLSSGRQPSLWEELKECNANVLLVYGEKDVKFKQISSRMYHEMNHRANKIVKIIEIPGAGHAVHLENPLLLMAAVRKFITRVHKNSAGTEALSEAIVSIQ